MTPARSDTAESMGIKIGPTVRKIDWYPFVAYGRGLNGEGRILIRENFITVSAGDDGWMPRGSTRAPIPPRINQLTTA